MGLKTAHKQKVHSLTGRIDDVLLYEAFRAVRSNRGAAGIDKVSIQMFEENLFDNLRKLKSDLKTGIYSPYPLRREYIDKGSGRSRPLGIPAVRDRTAQETVRRLLEPIFEPQFHEHSYGFRPGRNCHQAVKQVLNYYDQGHRWVVDADIKGFFDSIPHEIIEQFVSARVADGNILDLLHKFLRSGVMEDGEVVPTRKGTPQGGVISPLLANIVLDYLDQHLDDAGFEFVRYADDFVILCRDHTEAERALSKARNIIMRDLGMKLNRRKTSIVQFKNGLEFLGFRISSWSVKMRDKAVEEFKSKVKKLTPRSRNLDEQTVKELNRVIRGTMNYFSTSFSSILKQVKYLDRAIRRRLRCMKFERKSCADNGRLRNKDIYRLGLLSCRQLCLGAEEFP